MAAGAKLGRAVEIHFSRFGLSTGRYRFLADLEDNDGEELPSQLAENLGVTRRSHFTALLRSFLRQNDRSLTDIVTSKRSPIFTDRLLNLMAEIITAHQEKKEGAADHSKIPIQKGITICYGSAALIGTVITWLRDDMPYTRHGFVSIGKYTQCSAGELLISFTETFKNFRGHRHFFST
jgi:hypothetical protein